MTQQCPLTLGQPAPDFDLPGPDGSLSASSLRGSWTVLYFYPRDNTSGCTTEALEFTELSPEFEKLGAKVVGVSKDSPESHRKFIDKHGLNVTLLSDESKKTLEAFGAWRLKKLYGKESMGTVRSTVLLDPQGNVAHVWPKVAKAAGHAAKVLEELKRLTVG
ncbi:MAG: peroxiredoxin [Desulfovibrionaceae bacterium]|jgi:peroxiredoxin Q/BCP